MIADDEKLEILETVLSSEEFSHSQKYKGLLKYLVEASLHNKDLDEMTIAAEFFGKNSNFDPLEDATIRVYISQIRKKLANYYLTQGKEDKIQIDIPKGHYAVRFCAKNERHSDTNKNRLTKLIFPVLTLFLSLIIIFLWIKYDRLNKKVEFIPKNNPIWGEYLNDNSPTLVILGDYFFMYEVTDDDKPRFNVRDPLINSLEDFQELYEKNPNEMENLKPLEHTYLRPSVLWGFLEIQPVLRSLKSTFLIKQASEIVWDDISSHNVIFIGTFKQMYILKTFLEKVNAKFSIYPNYLSLYDKNEKVIQQFTSLLNPETRQYTDVCLLAKISGPNNNTIMLITGFHEGGVIHGIKAISNPDFPKTILKDYGKELKSTLNFRSVIKVEGFRETELSSKIEYFETLSP